MRSKNEHPWQKIYAERYSGYSKGQIEAGIRDWEQRSDILLRWLEREKVSGHAKILDCGCGIGIGGIILKNNGYENITGIDIDGENVKAASKFFEAYGMDCNNINLKNRFDIVIALNIIEHLGSPEHFLDGLIKILSPKGLLVLSLPNEIWFRKLSGRIPKDPTHRQSWSVFSFKRFLSRNGFDIIDMKPVGRIPFLIGCQTFMVLAKVR